MEDFFRKSFLAGIGLLSLTEEKCRKTINAWVKKGELTEKEGKELFNSWKEKYQDLLKDIEKKIEIQIAKFIEKANIPTKKDIDKLEKKIKSLEEKIKKLEKIKK